ncbi:MAG: EAL domain-containing protein [Oscillibacter sp.]|nr:EAL domain-containing protein [Oscillibacter sp.]
MPKNILLIVDDAEVHRIILINIFQDQYEILTAGDGRQALELLAGIPDGRITVVLLDLIMPVMDGYAVLEEMTRRDLLRAIPVIVLTGDAAPDTEASVLARGAWDFITKPYQPSVVKKRVENVIRICEASEIRTENLLLQKQREAEHAASEQIRCYAEHDELTGLYNRRKFCAETERMLAKDPDTAYVLVYLDVNRFNAVNDVLGEGFGDRILMMIADVFRGAFRTGGVYGRLEADHFSVCAPEEMLSLSHLREIAHFDCSRIGLDYSIDFRFGIYRIRDRKLPVTKMLDRADAAAHAAHENYLQPYIFYDESMREKILAEQAVSEKMESALKNGQFEMYLQPQFSLSENRPIGAEALVRWNDPDRGIVAPGEFIPVFEKNGFIAELDKNVWEQACRYLADRRQRGLESIPISVNLSRRSIYRRNLAEDLGRLLKKYELEPQMLGLEVTESAYTEDPDEIRNTVLALQQKGFCILMDDFGSGYSSLNMLKDLPVDILKIDMKFLQNFETSSRAGSIITSVLRMARWLRLPVIAEGVETRAQVEFLESIGCDRIQGYYFSKPLPPEQFEEYLRRRPPAGPGETAEEIPDVNFDELFGGSSFLNQLFSHVFGGVAFYEYTPGKLEAIRANRDYFEIYGFTPETFAEKAENVFDNMPARDARAEEKICQKVIRTGSIQRGVFAVDRCPDGRRIWVERIYCFLGGNEKRALLCIAANQISDRQSSAEQLSESAGRFSALLNRMRSGVLLCSDQRGELSLISANPGYYRMLGYTNAQYRARWKDPLGPVCREDRGAVEEYLHGLAKSGEAVCEYLARRRGGTEIWLHCRGICMKEGAGRGKLLFLMISDVTEEKHRRSLSAREAERCQLAARRAERCVFEWDEETGRFFAPPGLERFALNPECLRQDGPADWEPWVHPEDWDVFRELLERVRSGELHTEAELRLKKTDGGFDWTSLTVDLEKDGDSRICRRVGSLRDIEDRVRGWEKRSLRPENKRGAANLRDS